MNRRHVILPLLAGLIGGCAAGGLASGASPGFPAGWQYLLPPPSAVCADLGGEYDNIGEGYLSGAEQAQQVRLDAALGFPLPAARKAGSMVIVDSPEQLSLRLHFVGEEEQRIDLEAHCVDGWRRFQIERTSAYLGDGVQMASGSRAVSLTRARDGSLIVHQRAEEKYRTAFVFRSESVNEGWHRYPLVEK